MSKAAHVPLSPLHPATREAWLEVQASGLAEKFKAKYRAGQIEHDGDLGEVSAAQLLDEMEAEALDQLAYVRELKHRLSL